jgi:phage recombination protein Bet
MSDKLEVIYNLDGNNIYLTPSIVQQYIVSGNAKITIPEYKFFTEMCKARGLNPFLKEVYLIKYSDKEPAAIVVGKDAILKRAITNKNYDGMESGIIIQNTKDEVISREGTFKLADEKLVGGWAKVHRKNWQYPTYVSVSFEEVAQKKYDGSLNANWSKKGATMVEKVAKVRALRETFIEDLGGLYEE